MRDDTFDTVERPRHYNIHPSGVETIQVTRLCSFNMGNAIKYCWRHPDKNGLEDLLKARFYLRDLLATGQPRYLPYKAKELLGRVLDAEDNELRLALFGYLYEGDVAGAIACIDSEVVDKIT